MWDSDEGDQPDGDDEFLTAEEDYVAYKYEDLHDRLDEAGGLDEAYSENDVWDAVFDDTLQDDMEAFIDEQRADEVSHYRSPSRTSKGSFGCELILFLIAILGLAALCMVMGLGST